MNRSVPSTMLGAVATAATTAAAAAGRLLTGLIGAYGLALLCLQALSILPLQQQQQALGVATVSHQCHQAVGTQPAGLGHMLTGAALNPSHLLRQVAAAAAGHGRFLLPHQQRQVCLLATGQRPLAGAHTATEAVATF
jgi:hypothetical protein